jgi:hypothetical protein
MAWCAKRKPILACKALSARPGRPGRFVQLGRPGLDGRPLLRAYRRIDVSDGCQAAGLAPAVHGRLSAPASMADRSTWLPRTARRQWQRLRHQQLKHGTGGGRQAAPVNGVGGYSTQRADFVARAAVDLCLPMDRARNGHTTSSGQFANL